MNIKYYVDNNTDIVCFEDYSWQIQVVATHLFEWNYKDALNFLKESDGGDYTHQCNQSKVELYSWIEKIWLKNQKVAPLLCLDICGMSLLNGNHRLAISIRNDISSVLCLVGTLK